MHKQARQAMTAKTGPRVGMPLAHDANRKAQPGWTRRLQRRQQSIYAAPKYYWHYD